jgi:cytosine/uracil/thiamine/allantoin permease
MWPCAFNGYIGAKYGIPFPVLARASFGIWGSYAAIVIRGVVCVIWLDLIFSPSVSVLIGDYSGMVCKGTLGELRFNE